MEESNTIKPYAISKTLLLSVYGIIPVLFILTVLDFYFWDSFLKNLTNFNEMTAPLYVLFFELPHIISSFVSYADSEYLKFYKRNIFIYLPALLCITLLIMGVSIEFAFLSYLAYTMYHAIKQQTGIAKMFVGKSTVLHTFWSVLAILGAVIGNFIIFSPHIFKMFFFQVPPLLIQTLIVISFIVISLLYLKKIQLFSIGWLYVLFTALLLIGSYVWVVIGYFFFAIFVIRFVHDTTAFIFYAVHDSNRNAVTNNNLVYTFGKSLHVPLLLITPAFGIVVAYVLQKYGITFSQSAGIVIILGVTHYYIESFMWKRDALHRTQLRFTK